MPCTLHENPFILSKYPCKIAEAMPVFPLIKPTKFTSPVTEALSGKSFGSTKITPAIASLPYLTAFAPFITDIF